MNKYTVILDCGEPVHIQAIGFVVANGLLTFPREFNKLSEIANGPGIPMAVFPINKISCLMAEHDRDATNECGWDEIGGMRTVSVGEFSQMARRQEIVEEHDRRCNEALKKLGEAQAALDAYRSGALRPQLTTNIGMATKTPAIDWPENAGWRAQDADGQVRFFEAEPHMMATGWNTAGGDIWRDDSAAPNWKQSLIKRTD